jgi:hypothetical protein
MPYASASFDITASVLYFDTTNYDYQYLDVIVYANNYSGSSSFNKLPGLTYQSYIYNINPDFG